MHDPPGLRPFHGSAPLAGEAPKAFRGRFSAIAAVRLPGWLSQSVLCVVAQDDSNFDARSEESVHRRDSPSPFAAEGGGLGQGHGEAL